VIPPVHLAPPVRRRTPPLRPIRAFRVERPVEQSESPTVRSPSPPSRAATNTSNPTVMVAAGLLARNAVARGFERFHLPSRPASRPGSRAVTEYPPRCGAARTAPRSSGLRWPATGCTTCIGNSGPLDAPVAAAIEDNDLVVAAVLSGNRNFEGRIHPLVRASYLASPPLVVAFALAGTVDVDLTASPLGTDATGAPIFLRDLWPSAEEVRRTSDRRPSTASCSGPRTPRSSKAGRVEGA